MRPLLLLLTVASVAQAHEAGLSRGAYTVDATTIDATLTLAEAEQARVTAAALTVSVDGAPCPGEVVTSRRVKRDGQETALRYRCPAAGAVTVDFALLDTLPLGHRHLATAAGPDTLLRRGHRTLTLDATAPPPPATASFLWLGIEHILLGFDHLVFVIALVLVGGRLRDLLFVVTAFTLGHSVTLGLATLGVWAPSGTVIEPLIALSIAWVGLENFLAHDASKRWRLTLPFGLIHGFGFAGALAGIGLPPDAQLLSLVLFNAGVELGQLLVLAPILPVVLWARGRPLYDRRMLPALSAAVVVVGCFWFVERTLLG